MTGSFFEGAERLVSFAKTTLLQYIFKNLKDNEAF